LTNKTRVAISRWMLLFGLVMVVFLWVLRPVAGIISLAVVLLAYNLAITLSPKLHEALTENKARRKEKLQSLMRTKRDKTETTGPSSFTPTHYLLSSSLDPPICRLVDKESFVVGRDVGCDLRIAGDGSVSGQHCRITFGSHSRQYYVEDLRSSLGTYVGTKRLEANAPEKLMDEAEIFISNLRFTFTRTPLIGATGKGGYTGGAGMGGQVVDGLTRPEQAGMMLTLSISHDGTTQTRTEVISGSYTIGRSAQCKLVLSGDPYVGRRHAMILVQDGQVSVQDLNAQNGTYVGETRIPSGQTAPVANGDMLRIGHHYIQVNY
jgi:pSer/pThr/pTyr-binding forkhead associated (FHA) protein